MTSRKADVIDPAAQPGRSACPAGLTAAVRRAVRRGGDSQQTVGRVASALRRHLPGTGILNAAQLAGDPAGYQTHRLHAEPDGSFSIAAMVWRPGQVTPIHDHVSWCVTGVLQGTEYEEIFAPGPGGAFLTEVARRTRPARRRLRAPGGHPSRPQQRHRHRGLRAHLRRRPVPPHLQHPLPSPPPTLPPARAPIRQRWHHRGRDGDNGGTTAALGLRVRGALPSGARLCRAGRLHSEQYRYIVDVARQ